VPRVERVIVSVFLAGLLQNAVVAATPARHHRTSRRAAVRPRAPIVDPTVGDNVDGDDLVIRRAAVEALGTQNGSIVVVDPTTGRVLTMVNQRLALQSGFIPCSTIKLVTALAALNEGVVERDTPVKIGRYTRLDLTTAIAHSNNEYFGVLGTRLGFDRVIRYARMLGLGEKAGLDIEGEQAGEIAPSQPKYGGMGLVTAFGEGFQVTPLELAALLSAIANGGTLNYLQYPQTPGAAERFVPHVKRQLDLTPGSLADIKVGMRGAVDYGTARRAAYDPTEPVLGKTGTCTDFRVGSHMGWFASFNEVGAHKLVVVVMLTSPVKSVSGGVASAVAGTLYRNLASQNFFAANGNPNPNGLPQIMVTTPCCLQ
jgi:penicillin-binding protein 2